MRLRTSTLKVSLLAASILVGAGYAATQISNPTFRIIPEALAQQTQGSGQGQGQGGAGSGSGSGGGGYGGGDARNELEDLLRRGGRGGVSAEVDEDSDRPDWAQGNREANPHAQGGGQPAGAGSKKGDLYGDLYVILRDENGVPILLTLPSGEQVVQPVDADGNLIPLNEEGEPADAAAAALLQEVEFSRLSVGRSPNKVTDQALDDALTTLASIYTLDSNNNIVVADGATITYDAAGRLVVTVDGVAKTIDSPLANLALYTELMTTGALTTVVTLSYTDESGDTAYVTKEVDIVPALDLDVAASLLAASADKTGTITIDLVAYQNSILGVNTVVDGVATDYFDYSSYTYDRATALDGVVITYLQATTNDAGDTIYVIVEKSVLDAVFGGEDGVFDVETENVTASNIAGFTIAADDSLQIIEFVHTYEVPD